MVLWLDMLEQSWQRGGYVTKRQGQLAELPSHFVSIMVLPILKKMYTWPRIAQRTKAKRTSSSAHSFTDCEQNFEELCIDVTSLLPMTKEPATKRSTAGNICVCYQEYLVIQKHSNAIQRTFAVMINRVGWYARHLSVLHDLLGKSQEEWFRWVVASLDCYDD